MAGHSKWANIKHKKAAQDAKRGKVFTKLIREITVAAKLGGQEISDNPRLRSAVDKAFAANMTKDTIQRAIDRGAGLGGAGNVEELIYEGYGPCGIAFLVEVISDNRNRTVSEVRYVFAKYGGKLGTDGSVSYLFSRRGQIITDKDNEEDALIEIALESGAEDVIKLDDGTFDISTGVADFSEVEKRLKSHGVISSYSEIVMVPDSPISIDEEATKRVISLIEMLEDLEDVQNVFTNANFEESFIDSIQ